MASKKKTRRGRGPGGSSASDFIRSLPASTPAKDVVTEGAKKGLKFSINLVYAVRGKKAGPAKRRGRPAGAGRAAARSAGGPARNLEATLRGAIALLGLARAREIFADVEAAFSGR